MYPAAQRAQNARGWYAKGRTPVGVRPLVLRLSTEPGYAAAFACPAWLCSSAIEPRLERATAIASRIIESTVAPTRPQLNSAPTVVNGAARMPTRFITLIIGLSAGPAVSLNGSPTVS